MAGFGDSFAGSGSSHADAEDLAILDGQDPMDSGNSGDPADNDERSNRSRERGSREPDDKDSRRRESPRSRGNDKDQDDDEDEREGRRERRKKEDEDDLGDDDQDQDEQDEDDRPRKRRKEEEEDEPSDRRRIGSGKYKADVTFGDVKSKYPNFFKDFPGLKPAFFREREFSKLFPTVEDAQDAYESARNMEYLETSIGKGSSKELLEIIQKDNPRNYERFLDDFIPTLWRQDRQSFLRVTEPVIKMALNSAKRRASEAGSEDLVEAVDKLAQFFFKNGDLSTPRNRSNEDPELEQERQNLEREKRSLLESRYVEARRSIAGETERSLQAFMHDMPELKPDDRLTSYEFRNLQKDAIAELDQVIANDPQHIQFMGSLWKRAEKASFSVEFQKRIHQAYMTRAKILLPQIVKHLKHEILKSNGSRLRPSDRVVDDREEGYDEDERQNSRRTPPSGGRRSGGSSRIPDSREVDYDAADDRALLDGDIPTRRDRRR